MKLLFELCLFQYLVFLSVKGTLGPGTHGPPGKRASPAPRAARPPFGYQGPAPRAAMPRLGAPGTGRALKGPKLKNKKKPAKKTKPGPKLLGIDNGQSPGFFFFGFYKSRKRKLHYHDARSKAIALVKVARPRCRALAFVSCWPTLVSVQS